MTQYVIRRILYSIPVIIGILVVTFVLARSIPGDPCKAMLGEKATAEVCERYNREHGLDQPIPVQFWVFMKEIARGDFGESLRFSRPVTIILIERLPTTIELGLAALILAIIIGIPAGIIAAIRRNSILDVLVMIGANTGVSMPVYWLGLMLAYFFSLVLRDTPFWLPPSGRLTAGLTATPFYEMFGWEVAQETLKYHVLEFFANMYIFNSIITRNWEVLGDTIKHLILPAVALSTISLAIIARMTRSSMLEVLRQDYIRTARAKGLREQVVIVVHALKNSLIPVVTILGPMFASIVTGTFVVEQIFGINGMGKHFVQSVGNRDYQVITGLTLLFGMILIVANLMVDIMYAWLDPRIRYE